MKRLIWIMAFAAICMQGMAQNSKTTTGKPSTTTQTKQPVASKLNVTKAAEKKAAEQKAAEQKAAEKTEIINNAIAASSGYFYNPPLPYLPNKLDILFIGNSFSIDTSAALPEIFSSMGITNVNVYVLYKAACTLKGHYENYKSGAAVYELYCYNYTGEQQLEKSTSINDVMKRFPYDVVIFQQFSLDSADPNTYEPYLSKLIQAYQITKIGTRTTFAFNEIWAYSSTNKNIAKFKTPTNMWKSICAAVQKMKATSGIDVIIPCGTAVQNARTVEALNVDNEMTRDGTHINLYAGRYLLACTFFESIIAPCLNRNLRDDTTTYGKSEDIGQVNNQNRRLLQNCARLAVAHNYDISEFAGQ